jgi:pectate lyase
MESSDVCEDAATNSKDGATMTLNHVIALHASDKVFQHNAKGRLSQSNVQSW